MREPFSKTFSTPPRSIHRMAFFMYSWPWILGARERANWSNKFYRSRKTNKASILREHEQNCVQISDALAKCTRHVPSSYLRASSAEVLDLGHIICREVVRDFFAHLFDVAGDHDSPEQRHMGNDMLRIYSIVVKQISHIILQNSFTWRCPKWIHPSCQAGSGRCRSPAYGPLALQRPPSHCPGWCPLSGAADQQELSLAFPELWWSGGLYKWTDRTQSPADCSPRPEWIKHKEWKH